MFLDPFFLTLILLTASLGFFILLILPSIIEIRKPKDREPRRMLRTPLQKIIRSYSKPVSISKPVSVDHLIAVKDLQDFLKEVGVKTHRIGQDTIRIFGDFSFPPNLEIFDNLVVEGAFTVDDRCVFNGSVKAKGNVFIGSCVVIKGNLLGRGNVEIHDEAVIGGSVHAEGSVRLGEKVFIGSSVVADGDVELYENSEVQKNIITEGVIKVRKCPELDFPTNIEDIG